MSNQLTMHVDIVSAEHQIFSGRAEWVFLTGELGGMGIAARHAPLLTTLRPGPVKIRKANGEEDVVFVSGGILEVQPDVVTILADTVARCEDMDEEAAEKAREIAEEKLSKSYGSKQELYSAREELERAVGIVRTIKELRGLTKHR